MVSPLLLQQDPTRVSSLAPRGPNQGLSCLAPGEPNLGDALNLQNTVIPSTLIDLIVTTRKDLVSSVGTHPLGISDHNLIYSTIMLKNKRPPPKIICVRQFQNFDEKKFKEDIRAAPFYVGSIFDDPDNQMWFWQQLYSDICDQHAPWKEIKIRASCLKLLLHQKVQNCGRIIRELETK